jgi:hypothetical protein
MHQSPGCIPPPTKSKVFYMAAARKGEKSLGSEQKNVCLPEQQTGF